jgi:hypothetical protein
VNTDRQFALAFGILLGTMLNNSAAAIAQSCEALDVDTSSPLSYQFRVNAPRCEGLYRYRTGGDQGMALVSLTFGKVAYDTKRDQYLEIKLQAKPTEKTLIRGVGVPERLYYRLDFELGPERSEFRLPLADVVVPGNILPEAFGIYGMRSLPGGQNAFVPVYARGAAAPAQTEMVVAVVRPRADVTDVQWRLRDAPGVPTTAWVPVVGASGLVPRGTRLEIPLGKDIPPQMTLEVSFLLRGVGASTLFALATR